MGGTSCLIRACERGLCDIVYKLLEKGADYNQTKEASGKLLYFFYSLFVGNTPLHIATINKNFELIKMLLDQEGLDLKKKNKQEKTAMDIVNNDQELKAKVSNY